MILIVLVILLSYLLTLKINFKLLNKDYLSKDNTKIINGIFVVIVFLSHFSTYITKTDITEQIILKIVGLFGQLMVTTFLFFSGYGLFESIKKKENYIDNFLKKRFFPIYFNFFLAVILFIFANLILGNNIKINQVLLSFIGWDSVGNSNWYMMLVFFQYLAFFIVFKYIKVSNFYRLIIMLITSILYIEIIGIFKDSYWIDTVLCFNYGLFFSYYKDKIDKIILKNNIITISLFILSLLLFIPLKLHYGVYFHNVTSIVFVSIIVLVLTKFKSNSKILSYLGENVFWVYILQRIPFMLFKGIINNNYLYLLVSIIVTLLLTIVMNKVTNYIYKKRIKI